MLQSEYGKMECRFVFCSRVCISVFLVYFALKRMWQGWDMKEHYMKVHYH